MTLKVNGVDLVPYIAFQGFKWSRNDVESENAGRTLDGVMHRGRQATKIRLDITCRILNSSELQTVLQTIYPETVSVDYYDPMSGLRNNVLMYSNNNPAEFCLRRGNGEELWHNITFALIEV